jgi:predicted GIY-YIG superfamily endonuclease
MRPFFVYMLRCRNGSYYVGHTDDLEKRVAQHVDGTFGGHTSRLRPVELVWSAETNSRANALEQELRIKAWSRAKKEALIREDWNALKALARGKDRPGPSTPRVPGGPRYARDERGSSPCQERVPSTRRARGSMDPADA